MNTNLADMHNGHCVTDKMILRDQKRPFAENFMCGVFSPRNLLIMITLLQTCISL